VSKLHALKQMLKSRTATERYHAENYWRGKAMNCDVCTVDKACPYALCIAVTNPRLSIAQK
jgi:hypothetical protein